MDGAGPPGGEPPPLGAAPDPHAMLNSLLAAAAAGLEGPGLRPPVLQPDLQPASQPLQAAPWQWTAAQAQPQSQAGPRAAATAVDAEAQAKLAAARERNRLAQQRFRERQRAKAKMAGEQCEVLQQEIEQVRLRGAPSCDANG